MATQHRELPTRTGLLSHRLRYEITSDARERSQRSTYFGSMSTSRKHRMKRLAHLFSGLLILLHAYERFAHGHSTWWIFVLAGVVFLSVAALHAQLAKRWPHVDMVFFMIEAMLSFVIMGEYFHAGKRGLPFMYLAAGIGQLVAAVKTRRKAAH